MAFRYDPKTGIIFDTDIGFDPDDFFALLLLLNSPEITLDLVVTGDEHNGGRATLTREILKLCGQEKIPVAAGADLGSSKYFLSELVEEMPIPQDGGDDATDALLSIFDRYDRVVYVGAQGMTNIARFIERRLDVAQKLSLYQMGGAINFSRYPGWVEHNVRIDVPSARKVLASGAEISLIMAQTTTEPELQFNDDQPIMKRIRASAEPVHRLLLKNITIARQRFLDDGKKNAFPYAHDPLTASVALGKDFVTFDTAPISLDDKGNTFIDPANGKPMKISRKESRAKEFMEFLEERIFSGH